ncbi:MAG TPA: phosphate signaling complex protein PhoU [Xanthobacteraceae bacterium]|nr:phosphate signaling complex protein PhoU [Xanthobacteraceae bacterium]
MEQHTVKRFDAELDDLTRKVVEMGRLVEQQVAGAINALAGQDFEIAQSVVMNKDAVDALHREIQEKGIVAIARRQPVAMDLREIVGTSRIAHDLEHVGDLAEGIAKRVLRSEDQFRINDVVLGVERMGELVLDQLKEALASYAQRDSAKALQVWRADAQVDAVYNSRFRELLTYMMEDAHRIGYCTDLLLSIKNIERIGDHVANVAESIHYIVEGRELAEGRAKDESTRTVHMPTAD